MNSKYTTRSYPYVRSGPNFGTVRKNRNSVLKANLALPILEKENKVRRMVIGIDSPPNGSPMSKEKIQELGDPFATLILSQENPALSLEAILEQLDSYNGTQDGISDQELYMIAEGGQIPWSKDTENLDRGLRVVVTRAAGQNVQLMVSTTYPFDDEDNVFLQVIGWDETLGVFNFYDRRDAKWFWAGNSWHALNEPTRGKGPFDSHINGSVVMKELTVPWIHWHSQAQSIPWDSFGEDSPLKNDPLLQSRSEANFLESSVIEPLIGKWTKRRVDVLLQNDSQMCGVVGLMRQVLTTTSYNLSSSPASYNSIKSDNVKEALIPTEFFVDNKGLIDEVGIAPKTGVLKFVGRDYKQLLEKYEVSVSDYQQNYSQKGDVFFAFLTPVRAFEDNIVLRELIGRELISRKFAAALLMVDFYNPVNSDRRSALMRHVSDCIDTQKDYPIERAMLNSICSCLDCLPETDPAFEVIENMSVENWEEEFSQRITDYLNKAQNAAKTYDGLDNYFRLLESRRRIFRKKPLSEFDLTMPHSNISSTVPLLMMTKDACVIENNFNE